MEPVALVGPVIVTDAGRLVDLPPAAVVVATELGWQY